MLQARWSNNVGFLSRTALSDYIERKQLLIVRENGQPAGYLNWSCTKTGLVRVIQLALEPEVLRTHIGTKIVKHLVRAGQQGCCSIIRLKGRSNLDAHFLWPTLGFALTATFLNPTARALPLLEWTYPLLAQSDIVQGLVTRGKSFRPLLKTRTPPDIRSVLLSDHPLTDPPG